MKKDYVINIHIDGIGDNMYEVSNGTLKDAFKAAYADMRAYKALFTPVIDIYDDFKHVVRIGSYIDERNRAKIYCNYKSSYLAMN